MPIVRSNKLPVKHPGLVFKDKFLDADNMTEVEKKLHITRQELINFAKGKSSMSIQLGQNLECLTGISLEFWINLQKKYDLHTNNGIS